MISTLVADPEPHRPHVRLSRPPRLDPPYDDERDAHGSAERTPRSQPCPVQEAHPQASVNASPASALTSGRAALALVRLCIEVLNGYRPPSHLRRLGGTVEFGDIVDQLHRRRNGRNSYGVNGSVSTRHRGTGAVINDRRPVALSRPANAIPAQRRLTAGVPVNAATQWAPVSLTRLRVSEPLDGIAEAVAVLSLAGSSCALALRLERTAGAWTCAIAQVV